MRTQISIEQTVLGAALLLTVGTVGGAACSSGPEARTANSGDELTGTAQAELQQAPANVRCVTIQVSNGTSSVAPSFNVSPQMSTQFALKGLPLGMDTFQATASTAACSNGGAVPAVFASSPVTANVANGMSPTVALQMQAVTDGGSASVGVDFPPSTSGVVTDFPVPAGFAANAVTNGPDGNLWAILTNSMGNSEIVKVTTAGAVTVVSTLTSRANALTSGPDGNIWFTTGGNTIASPPVPSQLSHMAPDGSGLVSFSFGSASASDLSGLTTGPDGAMWVCDDKASAILHVSLTGNLLQQLPTPSSPGIPDSIVVGSDGNLWFNELTGAFISTTTKIAQLNPSTLAIVEVSVSGTAGSLAAGPDGNIYSTVSPPPMGGPTIAKITPPNTLVQTPFPGGSSIAAGPDGNVWFLELRGVGRLRPDGTITEFPSSRNGTGGGIVAGPDGNVWFSEGTSIARITP
jgi:virginiamycin B lyase